jgi:hypothetical protein
LLSRSRSRDCGVQFRADCAQSVGEVWQPLVDTVEMRWQNHSVRRIPLFRSHRADCPARHRSEYRACAGQLMSYRTCAGNGPCGETNCGHDRYGAADPPERFERIVQSRDTANKAPSSEELTVLLTQRLPRAPACRRSAPSSRCMPPPESRPGRAISRRRA